MRVTDKINSLNHDANPIAINNIVPSNSNNGLKTEENMIIKEIQSHKNIYTDEEIISKLRKIFKKVEKSESARAELSKMLEDVEVKIDLHLQRASRIKITKQRPTLRNKTAYRSRDVYFLLKKKKHKSRGKNKETAENI